MRLYNIYYICSICKETIEESISLEQIKNSAGTVTYRINGWRDCRKALEQIRNVSCFKEQAESVYESLGVVERDKDNPIVTSDVKNKFIANRDKLLIAMKAVISLYQSLDLGESFVGIDVKIPKCNSLKEYMEYLKEIDFIFTQCPYLLSDEEEIKFYNVDVGSQWLVFVVAGITGAFCILNHLSALINKAIAIKSNILVLKQQDAILKSMQQKNEVTEEVIDVFKTLKHNMIQDYVNELENELGPLKDGEERGKVQKSLEKLATLMDKGVELYSSIETPNDIKVLFPMNEDNPILPDNIIKLLEDKVDME